MPRNARYVIPGLPHHVTQRGTDRQIVFRSVADRHVYLDLIRESQSDCGARILAWCLMTNLARLAATASEDETALTEAGLSQWSADAPRDL